MNLKSKVTKVAVVIPIYRPITDLSGNEVKALTQIRTVLSTRDIFFIFPPSIDPNEYINLLEPLKVEAICVPSVFFGNLHRSNRLFTSHFLYNHFSKYDYMLVHHTDAFVFSDQLDYWCSQDLDYIGAPWFEGREYPVLPLKFRGVGNGGFSLRRVSSFLKITANRRFIITHFVLYKTHQFLQGHHYKFLRKYLGINFVLSKLKSHIGYEDEFWGLIVPKYYRWFKVAKPQQALKFSFEVLPEELFKLNDNKLPFGCHAWEKYDFTFWEPFIKPDHPAELY